MKPFVPILIFAFCITLWSGCKTQSVGTGISNINTDIVGSWEGCDGRVVTFTKEENGEIYGRYTQLGGLKKYNFSQDEIGYQVVKQSLGTYTGSVKWRSTTGTETWKKVTITIEGDTYKDDSSDGCSKNMKRIIP
jgi:hypothetical protein